MGPGSNYYHVIGCNSSIGCRSTKDLLLHCTPYTSVICWGSTNCKSRPRRTICNPHNCGSRFGLSTSSGSCGGLMILLHHYYLVEAGCQMGLGPGRIRVTVLTKSKAGCHLSGCLQHYTTLIISCALPSLHYTDNIMCVVITILHR